MWPHKSSRRPRGRCLPLGKLGYVWLPPCSLHTYSCAHRSHTPNEHTQRHTFIRAPHTLISHKHAHTYTHTDKLSHVLYCSHLTHAQATKYYYHLCVDTPDRNSVREERFILLTASKGFQPTVFLVPSQPGINWQSRSFLFCAYSMGNWWYRSREWGVLKNPIYYMLRQWTEKEHRLDGATLVCLPFDFSQEVLSRVFCPLVGQFLIEKFSSIDDT